MPAVSGRTWRSSISWEAPLPQRSADTNRAPKRVQASTTASASQAPRSALASPRRRRTSSWRPSCPTGVPSMHSRRPTRTSRRRVPASASRRRSPVSRDTTTRSWRRETRGRAEIGLSVPDVFWRALLAEARARGKSGNLEAALGSARAAIYAVDEMREAARVQAGEPPSPRHDDCLRDARSAPGGERRRRGRIRHVRADAGPRSPGDADRQ